MTEQRLARFTYKPALDGIRAIAVCAVLLYHSDPAVTVGGFLGVDLFFVLSGYLITSLLLAEHDHHGSISLGAFWSRRAKRLLPALLTVLVLVASHARFATDTQPLGRLRNDAIATLGYVANWWYIYGGQTYFDRFAIPSPLRHTWSLAIEEQFYIIWPLLLGFLLSWRRMRLRYLGFLTAAGTAVSAMAMDLLYDPLTNPSRVYFGTDTHAQVILVGCLLACVLHGRRFHSARVRSVIRTLGVISMLMFGVMVVFVTDTDTWMYHGGYLLVAVAAALMILLCVHPHRSIVKSLLSFRPLRFVGQISYGLYLYHWPVYVWLNPDTTGAEGALLLELRLVVTFAIAIVSYYVIELPVRYGTFRDTRRRLVAFTAAVAVPVFVLVATAGGRGDPMPAAPQTYVPNTVRVLLIGDSIAGSLGRYYPANVGARFGVSVISRGFDGCGIMEGQSIELGEGALPASCGHWASNWTETLREFDPDISIMLIGAWEDHDRIVQGKHLVVGTSPWALYFQKQLEEATRILSAGSRKVVLLAPPCYTPARFGKPSGHTPEGHAAAMAIFADFGTRHPEITLLDLATFVCPTGKYQPQLNGVPLHSDGSHYTRDSAPMVWRWLLPQLQPIVATTRRTPRSSDEQVP